MKRKYSKAGYKWDQTSESCVARPPPCTDTVCGEAQCQKRGKCTKGGCVWLKSSETCAAPYVSDACDQQQCQRRKPCRTEAACAWNRTSKSCSLHNLMVYLEGLALCHRTISTSMGICVLLLCVRIHSSFVVIRQA